MSAPIAPTLPVCGWLRATNPRAPRDGEREKAIKAADTIDALYEALEGLAIMAGKLVVRADGKFRPERRAVLDAMIIAETALTLAREGAPHDQQ